MSERKKRERWIMDRCEQAGCSKKIAAIHFDQYVDRHWNPHPPQQFMAWWDSPNTANHMAKETGRAWDGVKPVVAYNCQAVRDVYLKDKAVGIA